MTETLLLNSENVDITAERVTGYLEQNDFDRPTVVRTRLFFEDILLSYLELPERSENFRLSLEKRFGQFRIVLRVPGERMNPLDTADGEEALAQRMLSLLSLSPVWTYTHKTNVITFTLAARKKIPDFVYSVAALLLGLGCGALSLFLPAESRSVLIGSYLAPVSDTVMGFLTSLSVFLIFFSIVNGICGIGDAESFKRIGIKMFGRFALMLVISALLCVGVTLCFVPFGQDAGASLNPAVLWQMILDIVPKNIPEAFISGNALQVIFLSILCGTALLILSYKVKGVTDLIAQINLIIQEMMKYIIKCMPIVIFISLFRLTAETGMKGMGSVWTYPVVMILYCVIVYLFCLFRTVITQHVSPMLIAKKLFPAFLICMSTSSSSAAFSENVETCKKKLGIKETLVDVAVPLGQILFMPSTAYQLLIGCMCLGPMYGVHITLPTLITLFLSSLILAVAAPPVPAIMVSMFTILFTSIGVPLEAVSIILALEPLLDPVGTAFNISSLQLELIQLAGSLDLLDREKLRK